MDQQTYESQDVAVYDGRCLGFDTEAEPEPIGIDRLPPPMSIHPQPGWTVAALLEAADATGYNSFCMITEELAADARLWQHSVIAASWDLLGLDEDGVAYYQGRPVLWTDFVRAADAGLYQGDPRRLLLVPGGAAGGLMAVALVPIILWVFEHRDDIAAAIAGGFASVKGVRWTLSRRQQQIGQQWLRSGMTGPRVLRHLRRLPQWDPERLGQQLGLTVKEARELLTRAGYEEAESGLWRLGQSAAAIGNQQAASRLVGTIESSPDRDWGDAVLHVSENEDQNRIADP